MLKDLGRNHKTAAKVGPFRNPPPFLLIDDGYDRGKSKLCSPSFPGEKCIYFPSYTTRNGIDHQKIVRKKK